MFSHTSALAKRLKRHMAHNMPTSLMHNRLIHDCRGVLDLRMILLLMLLGGGGFGGFTLLTQGSNTSGTSPFSPQANAPGQGQAEEMAEDALQTAKGNVQSALEDARQQMRQQTGVAGQMKTNLNRAASDFRRDVQMAQAKLQGDMRQVSQRLLTGDSPQDVIQEAMESFRADIQEARDRFSQSLGQMTQTASTTTKREPPPFIVNMTCDVADGLAKSRGSSQTACNREGSDVTQTTTETSNTGQYVSGQTDRDGNNEDAADASGEANQNSDGTGSPGGDTQAADKDTTAPDQTASVQFPLPGLYHDGLDVDGQKITCPNTKIYVGNNDDPRLRKARNGYKITGYSGASVSVNGTESRDLAFYPSTIHLDRTHLGQKSTREKVTLINQACQQAAIERHRNVQSQTDPNAEPDGLYQVVAETYTNDFPAPGLYDGVLDIDGFQASCPGKKIYVGENKNDPRLSDTPPGRDFKIGTYRGGSINMNGVESRDYTSFPSTIHLDRSIFTPLSTAEKMAYVNRACYRTDHREGRKAPFASFMDESCYAFQKGKEQGWINNEVNRKWCYYRDDSGQCSSIGSMCLTSR